MGVSAEHYLKMKHESSEGEMSMMDYCMPVDLNGAYVPLEVTQASKGSDKDLKIAAENIKYRFGL